MKSISVAARLRPDEVTEDLAMGFPDSIARWLEAICVGNCYSKGRLHSGRRCLPLLDSCDWATRSFVFVGAVACLVPRITTSIA